MSGVIELGETYTLTVAAEAVVTVVDPSGVESDVPVEGEEANTASFVADMAGIWVTHVSTADEVTVGAVYVRPGVLDEGS